MADSNETSGKSYWDAIEPIWKPVSIYDGPKVFLDAFAKLPAPVGHLYAAHWCSSEVCNGGLMQFFCNPTGVLGAEAVAGFRAIGLADTAATVEEAMAFFGPTYPRDQGARCAALAPHKADWEDGGPSPFDDLDDRFFELIEEENGGFGPAMDRYAEKFA